MTAKLNVVSGGAYKFTMKSMSSVAWDTNPRLRVEWLDGASSVISTNNYTPYAGTSWSSSSTTLNAPMTAVSMKVYLVINNNSTSYNKNTMFDDIKIEEKAPFDYDNNGNLVQDANRSVSEIVYNQFNLPVKITKTDAVGVVRYAYNQSGQRVMKKTATDSMYYVRDFSGATILEFKNLPDSTYWQYLNLMGSAGEVIGQKRFNSEAGSYYFLKDHLGNIRTTLRDDRLFVDDFEYDALNATGRPKLWPHPDTFGAPDTSVRIVSDATYGNVVRIKTVAAYNSADIRSNNVNVVTGTEYFLKIRLKAQTTAARIYVGIQWMNASNTSIFTSDIISAVYPTSWTEYQGTVTAPAGAKYARIRVRSLAIATVYVDEVKWISKNTEGGFTELEVMSAQDYGPFGEVLRETSANVEANKFKYQGKERDIETGYDYFEARIYDPQLGRFLQVDPMMEKFPTMNPYMGMNNNPIRMIDPTGLMADFYDENGEYLGTDGKNDNKVYQTTKQEVAKNTTEGAFCSNDPDDAEIIDWASVQSADNTTYLGETNSSGLILFPSSGNGFDSYPTVDAGGNSTDPAETVGSGDHYLKPSAAAGLMGLIKDLRKDGITLTLGDMSSSNGSDPWQSGFKHHKGHGHLGKRSGMDIDFRYVDTNGKSIQSPNAFGESDFSAALNQTIYTKAVAHGFKNNFQGTSGNLSGATKDKQHNDHGHLGR